MNTRENEIKMINNKWRVSGNSDYFSETDTLKRLKLIAKTRAIEILEYYKNEQDINQNTPFSVEDYEIALEGIIYDK